MDHPHAMHERHGREHVWYNEGEVLDREARAYDSDPEAHAFTAFFREELERALDELPDDFRMVVVLADLQGFSYKEIAGMISCPIGTVMSRLFSARKRLRAALEGVIDEAVAAKLRTRVILEIANGPVTPGADRILNERGVFIIPDILCNAGGVTVSYFEMIQNGSMDYWEENEVQRRLDKKITMAYQAVYTTSQEYGVNMRQAAYINAVSRIVEAMKLRGWI